MWNMHTQNFSVVWVVTKILFRDKFQHCLIYKSKDWNRFGSSSPQETLQAYKFNHSYDHRIILSFWRYMWTSVAMKNQGSSYVKICDMRIRQFIGNHHTNRGEFLGGQACQVQNGLGVLRTRELGVCHATDMPQSFCQICLGFKAEWEESHLFQDSSCHWSKNLKILALAEPRSSRCLISYVLFSFQRYHTICA